MHAVNSVHVFVFTLHSIKSIYYFDLLLTALLSVQCTYLPFPVILFFFLRLSRFIANNVLSIYLPPMSIGAAFFQMQDRGGREEGNHILQLTYSVLPPRQNLLKTEYTFNKSWSSCCYSLRYPVTVAATSGVVLVLVQGRHVSDWSDQTSYSIYFLNKI